MPRSYDEWTKLWVRRELRDALEELRQRYDASFNDLVHAWLEVFQSGLAELEERFLKALIRIKERRESQS